jgi:2',3'-cyclic-nucleotide 2'-phosphodiesterase/3'-nucleotidase
VKNGKWSVVRDKTQVSLRKALLDSATRTYVVTDPAISAVVQAEHASAIDYVKTPIGQSDFNLSTYFRRRGRCVGDPGRQCGPG